MLYHGRCGSVLLYCLHLGNQTGIWLPSSWVKTIPGQAFSPLSLTFPVCHTSVHMETLWQPWRWYQRTCCTWKMGSCGAKMTPFWPLLALTALMSSHPALSSCCCHSCVLTDFARRLVESLSNTELNYTLLCNYITCLVLIYLMAALKI